ncbi:hypothetical protein V6N12_055219 [Hibiscus sabdariffa]|uniref:Uncharacterized protein n=1 Tax=Hibiscus sabdariffa TaxID=183260 RepID=A0ABR2AK59_9ROSI
MSVVRVMGLASSVGRVVLRAQSTDDELETHLTSLNWARSHPIWPYQADQMRMQIEPRHWTGAPVDRWDFPFIAPITRIALADAVDGG